jgi:mono/diheme cytochrome c family protein
VKRALLVAALCAPAVAHDIVTTPVTWSRDISRIIYNRCAGCHREGGAAFSLMTYKDARPWVVAIREEVLRRTMPPWGAVKGFGDFRNDNSLTPEEIERIVAWSEGGVPEGDPKDMPSPPQLASETAVPRHVRGEIVISGPVQLTARFLLDGIVPVKVPANAQFQLIAELPDGSIEPLLWLKDYRPEFGHPFWFRRPLELPARTRISGLPAGATLRLLPTQ